jgi:ubiquinone biosynthesis UbiH/UbiF/VisC/COQ6 family hydroxylase
MKTDIIIIGSGPAGLSFARSLKNTALNITIIDRQTQETLANPKEDGRDVALTHTSKKILTDLGVWDRLPAHLISPIHEAKVLNGRSPYALHFDRRKINCDALGFLVPNHLLRKALYDEVDTMDNVERLYEQSIETINTTTDSACITLSNNTTINATLIVAADGRFSKMRQQKNIAAHTHDFQQMATVCRIEHEKPHHNVAYECFHYGYTLAILPLVGNQASVVITASPQKSAQLLAMDEQHFNHELQQRFNNRLGTMRLISKRYQYPLMAVYAKQFIAEKFALLGDAAVGMHPVTAHGFNLGLKGQNALATLIQSALNNNDRIDSPAVLNTYQSKHRRACKPLYLSTNFLVRFFTNERPATKLLRAIALRASNYCAPIKHLIMKQLTHIQ